MADVYRIVTEITKRQEDPWFIIGKARDESMKQFFTQQQIDEVLIPYADLGNSQPGFLKDQSSFNFDGNNLYRVLAYDSEENAMNAQQLFSKNSNNPIVQARNQLVREKAIELGVSYQVKSYFEFPPPEVSAITIPITN